MPDDLSDCAPQLERGEGRGPFVLVCEHASATIPDEFGALGLSPSVRAEHVAWDRGALAVALKLSEMLDCPVVHPAVSRLVIDCNRAEDHPQLIVAETEFGPVPGNRDLSPAERGRRIAAFHKPFHDLVQEVIKRRIERALPTSLVAIHSFTPVLAGEARPWHVGILYRQDQALVRTLVDHLSATHGVVLGLNEPYAPGDGVYYSLDRHAEAAGLMSVLIEVRNDLIGDEQGQHLWASRIAEPLRRLGRTPGASDIQQARMLT